jgi:phosphatidylserine decarboxylase
LDLPKGKYTRIAIFMNVFDVHVNRAPMAGEVTDKFYFPGAFLNASLDKASTDNERLGLVMKTDHGTTIGFVQIAGLVARRILCDAMEGDRLRAGEQYGIIRFGSRVDVWLPQPVKVLVAAGQTTLAGETMIADYARGAKANAESIAR